MIQQTTTSIEVSSDDSINTLLDEAAVKVGASIKHRIATDRLAPPREATFANLTIKVITAEVSILTGPDKTAQTTSPTGFSVFVDGLAAGSAPGQVRVRSGLSRIRVTHPDYQVWETQVSAVDGLVLTATVQRTLKSQTSEQATAAVATGLGFLSRAMIIGAVVLVAFATAMAFRGRRQRIVSGSTEVSVKTNQ